ncbi:MAG: HEPN domain-containing protein [Clostridiales bacterium]|nr:HEPN domain-containing protein [Clostridiales bacterium]
MNNDYIELSRYRLEKAKEDLSNAKANLNGNYLKGAVNRSYYAIFHAIRAVLALDGFDSKKHSGVIAYFNQSYVKTGIFSFEVSAIVQKAFKIRNKSDYDDFYITTHEEAEEQVKNAVNFLSVVEEYMEKRFC